MRLAVLALVAGLSGCGGEEPVVQRAQPLLDRYGCRSCHEIPSAPQPQGVTGPPLSKMSEQAYIAGVVPNTREALAAFITDPQQIDPRSAMPDLDVSPEEARTIADYLYAVSE